MKKILLSTLLAVAVAVSSFANDVAKVSYRVKSTFAAEFRGAQDVQWTSKEDFVKADFRLNGQKLEAYFQHDGQYIGTSKQVSLDELPTAAKRSFAKKYANYTVKEAIRFDGVHEGAYFISADNGTHSVVLKVGDTQGLSLYSRAKKD